MSNLPTNPSRRDTLRLAGGLALLAEQAPEARECHPREEHLLPLHVIAGAGGNDAASFLYRDAIMGAHVSAVHFG